MTDGNKLAENLISYAKEYLYLNSNDEDFIRLRLYKYFLLKPADVIKYKGSGEILTTEKLSAVLEDYLINNFSIEGDVKEAVSEVFALLTPMPSQIDRNFKYLREKMGVRAATDYFYGISSANTFIRKESYENKLVSDKFYSQIFFSDKKRGGLNHLDTDIRLQDNARVINFENSGRKYEFGYLKFNDFTEHAALALPSGKSTVIDKETLDDVTSFVEYIPEYAAVSSITGKTSANLATTDKFFLIKDELPVYSAKTSLLLRSEFYPDAEIFICDYPVSAIKIVTFSRNTVIELTHDILRAWDNYVDERAGVFGCAKHGANRSFVLIRMLGDGRFSVNIFFTKAEDFDLYKKKTPFETLFSTRYFSTALCGRFVMDQPAERAFEFAKKFLNKKGRIDVKENCPQFSEFLAQAEEKQMFTSNPKKAAQFVSDMLLSYCDGYLKSLSAFAAADNPTLSIRKFLAVLGIL